ncbi:MAG: hypothetical protein JRI68_02620 [Deltaproteobacteria bacterium]|nr:hypothetical protein [Deltaproteobacteria bacterium]
MRSSKEETRRRRFSELLVGAAILLVASPVLAENGSNSAQLPAKDRAREVVAAATPDNTLNIGYFDRADVPEEVMAAMQGEVERLLGELGVTVASLDASDLNNSEGVPAGTLLNVVIWERLPAEWDVPRHTMGVCPDSGELPRSVYVFETTILRELGLAWKGIDSMRTEDVGRAFGRVVAHEVVHAFATFVGEDRHRGNGLMGKALDKDTLLKAHLSVDERSGAAFLEGLAKAARAGS